MLNKKYELIKDGITIESHDKCREGLDELIESAEMILDEGHAILLWVALISAN